MCNKLKFEKGFEFSRLAAARLGSALTVLAAARSHSGSDSRLRLSFIALVPLRYVQGCHSLPSPFKSLFFIASKTKNSPMGCFCFVWLRR